MSTLSYFIKEVQRACSSEREFVVVLRRESMEEALEKIASRAQVMRKLPGLVQLKFKDVDISVSRGGKLLLKNVSDEEHVKEVLSALLLS